MRDIGVGIIGFGTIGAGVADVLLKNSEEIKGRMGANLKLVKIADLDIETDRGVKVDKALLSTDVNDVLENPDIDLVVELVGGYEPAKTFVLKALENGKRVVTANKALLAVHGEEILAKAAATKGDIAFEAAVGGGIPILRAVREGLAANKIKTIYGILNGTTNFILTEMKEKGESFDRVLSEAQKLGYAEADPTFDVEGVDAAHKITILALMAFGKKVSFDDVYTEGISGLTPQDIEYADDFGLEVKLLAIAKNDDEQIEVRVHPTMIPKDHLLSSVRGVYNAVYIDADFLGPSLYYGQGAGRNATASAVVGDLMELARDINNDVATRVPPMAFMPAAITPAKVKPMGEVDCRYYMRFMAKDKPGVLSKISGVLAQYSISIESVVQKGRDEGQAVPLVLMTQEARESDFMAAIEEIKKLGVIENNPTVVRVEK
jgi:homoserine dehydrogenase